MGNLNPDITKNFKMQFISNCKALLLSGYEELKKQDGLPDLTENNITLRLVAAIKKNPKRNNLQISITREAYLDPNEDTSEFVDADTVPRIDIKYSVWNGLLEHEFFAECKNLAENNWTRTTGSTVDASKLRRRYISTGIQNFVSGKYPYGCLVGYVLEGLPGNVVKKINKLLVSDGRSDETLSRKNIIIYCSTHSNYELEHYIFKLN